MLFIICMKLWGVMEYKKRSQFFTILLRHIQYIYVDGKLKANRIISGMFNNTGYIS